MKTGLTVLAMLLASSTFAQHAHQAADTVPAAAPPAMRPAPRIWTTQPLLVPGRVARGERAGALLKPQGIAASTVTVFAPEGPAERLKVEYPVAAEGAKIAPVTPKTGNYHWVIAREENPEEVRVATTAWYFGNPGDSPKNLLKVVKHELEIVPEPLPREHGSYRESEKWRFLVRFRGQPLPDQPVTLETEFGSRSTVMTDVAGIATVLFPRDFKPAVRKDGGQEGHGPRRAPFVLSTAKDADGRKYLTAFNLTYAQDEDRNRSLGWGAAFGLVGMLAATPLLRRRKPTASGENRDA